MSKILRWLPAILVMAIIFVFSSTPGDDLPSYGLWDTLVKKGGHMTGYALLALAYWYALGWDKKRWWLPILLAACYAATDEVHQAFTPGRHPSPVDVLVFDSGGAAIGVALAARFRSRERRKP
jgi:VanZ family protein